MASNLIPGQAAGDAAKSGPPPTGPEDTWMLLAKDAFKRSTTYYENNFQHTVEDGLRLFNSQHSRTSKYHSDAYKYRSKIFRPKTRSVIRKHEATAAMAFFSNPDVLTVDPENQEDPAQALSASITKELLQYRLTKSIPWFFKVLGAFQDAMTVGVCVSFQYWDYQTRKQKVRKQALATIFGQQVPMEVEVEENVVVVDKPCCDLIPVNNVRFDPAAKWDDVVGTSPYLILQLPMYLRDVLDRMELGYGKDGVKWKSLPKATILKARITEPDPVQQARDGRREDPQAVTSSESDFDLIMVHLNFIRTADGTFTFYTLKDQERLSEPVALEKAFLHGKIPVTIGFCVIETHKTLPSGLSQLGGQLQQETNEVANQRLDNVKLVLNKRYVVRRGSNIDVESMLRNVPGGVTMANDTEKDVREINWTDVTSSSFQEQDRLNADFDDLTGGGLNSSSVMTNRRLNETVGGMRLMAQGANSLTEYTIRVFAESWVEPTLRQLALLEQHYESDTTVLALAGQKAGAWQQFNQDEDLDQLLKHELTLTINVGMGATDPEQRLGKFIGAMQNYSQLAQAAPPDVNLGEVRKELFGLAGFKDNARFFQPADLRLIQAQKILAQAEGLAKDFIDQKKDHIIRRERQLDNRENDLDLREMEGAQELAGELRRIEGEFVLKQQEQAFALVHEGKKMSQDMALQSAKARNEANLAWFKAQNDAAVKKFLAMSKARSEARKVEAPSGE